MKRDLPSVIKRTARFLNKSITDEDVERLAEHLSFKNMKGNKAVNKEESVKNSVKLGLKWAILLKVMWEFDCILIFSEGSGTEEKGSFMRKGETGDWRSKLSEEQVNNNISGISENKITKSI